MNLNFILSLNFDDTSFQWFQSRIVSMSKDLFLHQTSLYVLQLTAQGEGFLYETGPCMLGNGEIWNFCNVAIVEGANSIEGCCDGNGRKHKDGEADLRYYCLCFSQTKV